MGMSEAEIVDFPTEVPVITADLTFDEETCEIDSELMALWRKAARKALEQDDL